MKQSNSIPICCILHIKRNTILSVVMWNSVHYHLPYLISMMWTYCFRPSTTLPRLVRMFWFCTNFSISADTSWDKWSTVLFNVCKNNYRNIFLIIYLDNIRSPDYFFLGTLYCILKLKPWQKKLTSIRNDSLWYKCRKHISLWCCNIFSHLIIMVSLWFFFWSQI